MNTFSNLVRLNTNGGVYRTRARTRGSCLPEPSRIRGGQGWGKQGPAHVNKSQRGYIDCYMGSRDIRAVPTCGSNSHWRSNTHTHKPGRLKSQESCPKLLFLREWHWSRVSCHTCDFNHYPVNEKWMKLLRQVSNVILQITLYIIEIGSKHGFRIKFWHYPALVDIDDGENWLPSCSFRNVNRHINWIEDTLEW